MIRRRRHARLLDQAYEQGGALAQTDLSAITLTGEGAVARDVKHVQEQRERLLPTRGGVQDLGPTISHKVDVIRLFEAGYLEPQIARKLSPVHILRSVERYVQMDKNVSKLSQQGFSLDVIARMLDTGLRLVAAYIELANEHHPDAIAANPHLHPQAMASSSPTRSVPHDPKQDPLGAGGKWLLGSCPLSARLDHSQAPCSSGVPM